MKRAIFRCDASRAIGTGHVIRSLTLAQALKGHGWTCIFACSKETSATVPLLLEAGFPVTDSEAISEQLHADILVIDGYQFEKTYETSLRGIAKKILAIDDLANKPHDCDILIDQTYGRVESDYRALVPDHCKILTGSQFALLRSPFAEKRAEALRRRTGSISRILIFISGSDPHGVTIKALRAITLLKNMPLIDVVIPSAAPFYAKADGIRAAHPDKIRFLENVSNMAELMTQADLCIGAGGTASWERCCLGLPALIIEIADNQKLIASSLAAAGAVVNLGWHEGITDKMLAAALEKLLPDRDLLLDMSAKALKICDGLGAERIVHAIEDILIA